MTTAPAFEGWAILEIMGHRTRPGFVQEVEIAGGKMLRVDIHGEEDVVVTEFYGVASIYSLRPVSEEIARDRAKGGSLRPVRPVEYREAALPAPKVCTGEQDCDCADCDRPF
jgi:hypothetical protein